MNNKTKLFWILSIVLTIACNSLQAIVFAPPDLYSCDGKNLHEQSVLAYDDDEQKQPLHNVYLSVPASFINQQLLTSAETGDIAKVDAALREGACIDAQNNRGETALHRAAFFGYIDLVHYLVNAKANCNVRNCYRETPLHKAVMHGHAGHGHVDIVQLLIKAQAKTSVKNSRGETPLHLAAFWGHLILVELLIAAHVDVDDTALNGDTALHKAILYGHEEIVQVLLDAKAKINIKNREGNTPLDEALRLKYDNIAKLFLEASAGSSLRAHL